jgi:hypothetical protein
MVLKVSQGDVKGGLAVLVFRKISIDEIKIRLVLLYL